MAFSWDEFAAAVSGYPAAHVTLQIVDLDPVTPSTGQEVNTGDIWDFKVRVRNNGHLNMTGVAFRITGHNSTQVSNSATGPWSSSITFPPTGSFSFNAHGGGDTLGHIYFKAPNAPKDPGTELVCAQILRFDANLNDLLIDHTGSSTLPRGCYKDAVLGS